MVFQSHVPSFKHFRPALALTFYALLVASTTNPVPAAAVHQSPIVVPAVIDEQLEVSGNTVPAKAVRTRMSVAVNIGDQGPFRFIVDSGADRTVIGENLAEQLSLHPSGTARLQSIAGLSVVRTVRIPTLSVGRMQTDDIHAPVLRERDLGAAGILGIDALAGQRLLLDFDRNEATFQDARRREKPAVAGEIVVTAQRRHGQLIMTEARAGGSAIAAVIDTGSQVTIGNMALLVRLRRGRRSTPLKPVTLTAVTGETIIAEAVHVGEIEIGKVLLRNVIIVFADLPAFRLFGLAERPAILLGTDLLSSFSRVGLDFSRRRVRFQLRR